MTQDLQYNVKSVRAAGLECRWARTSNGGPIIVGRMDGVGGGRWYNIHNRMWERAQQVGILQAFEEYCALGEFFSI